MSDEAAYALRLGDDALVLGQRLSEWAATSPQIEEDVALLNLALDQLGVARSLLSYAGSTVGRTEDDMAFLRSEPEFTNALLMELDGGDFGKTMARQLLVSAWQLPLWDALQASADETVAGVAGKAVKEADYHLDHARSWVVRLGDGTEESHRRVQAGLDEVWPYAFELFERDALTERLVDAGVAVDPAQIEPQWRATVAAVLAEATLEVPETTWRPTGGRSGAHTTAFGYLLAEMQHLHRSHPGGVVVTTVDEVREVLATVTDPEIPVITIEDLGILRDVAVDGSHVTVTITPTYSGCPAMDEIRADILSALAAHGFPDASVEMVLSPAWTTDWMSEAGKAKLSAYGIAPPARRVAGPVLVQLRPRVACPQCGSGDTEELTRFASTACKALWRCRSCREPFDLFKTL